jgi:hypothetical protein
MPESRCHACQTLAYPDFFLGAGPSSGQHPLPDLTNLSLPAVLLLMTLGNAACLPAGTAVVHQAVRATLSLTIPLHSP